MTASTARTAGADAGGIPRVRAAHGGPEGVRVLVDARGLRLSGIGRYLREITARMLADPRFGTVTMLGRPEQVRAFADAHDPASKVRLVPFAHHWYSAAAQAHWAWLGARGELRADVGFFSHYDVPLPPVPVPFAVAVQDLSHWRLAELFPAWKRALGRAVLARAVHRSARVLVSSRSTRADLLAFHPDVAGKTEVIPLGVGPEFVLDDAECVSAGVRECGSGEGRSPSSSSSPGPYLLCVGNRKPHKNMVAAVEVLARLRGEFPALRLVIVGKDFGEDDAVHARARSLGVESALVVREEVDDGALRGLYAGAACLVFPSLYEGFGLPVLEAMGCGAPVVASDRASVPEVAGDAALVVSPTDHDAMTDAVRRVLTDDALRADLVRRGRERARLLSWDLAARRTLDVLCEIARVRSAP